MPGRHAGRRSFVLLATPFGTAASIMAGYAQPPTAGEAVSLIAAVVLSAFAALSIGCQKNLQGLTSCQFPLLRITQRCAERMATGRHPMQIPDALDPDYEQTVGAMIRRLRPGHPRGRRTRRSALAATARLLRTETRRRHHRAPVRGGPKLGLPQQEDRLPGAAPRT